MPDEEAGLPSILQSEAFFSHLDSLKEEADAVDINNCPDVRDANRMAGGPETDAAIKRFEELHAQYPDSGNICSLRSQALHMSGRTAEAIAVAEHGFVHAKSKSRVAAGLGQIHLQEGRFVDAVSWLIRAMVLESHRAHPGPVAVYLGFLYSGAAMAMERQDLERAAEWLVRDAATTLDPRAKEHVLSMARAQCTGALAAAMLLAAQRYGWGYSARKARLTPAAEDPGAGARQAADPRGVEMAASGSASGESASDAPRGDAKAVDPRALDRKRDRFVDLTTLSLLPDGGGVFGAREDVSLEEAGAAVGVVLMHVICDDFMILRPPWWRRGARARYDRLERALHQGMMSACLAQDMKSTLPTYEPVSCIV
jgi:hypothetical protein